MEKFYLIIITFLLTASKVMAQDAADRDSANTKTLDGKQLSEVTVSARKSGRVKTSGLGNTEFISSKELLRAACCNLGESFTTNPSVDVNYADAATGAQQIKLLGLSGTYVQMLTENIPNYRGLASPYALGYIPGPWMQSIQVSKGASSVKNGYESITGQINVEFKKPQATPWADANVYFNSDQKLEANLGANLQLSDKWSTALLGHYEILDKAHDDNNDGFADMPKMRQGSLMSRWAYMSDAYIFQAAIKGLKEHREGGQNVHGHAMMQNPYLIDITNERYEAFTKNAFILNPERMTNIALILSGSVHHERSTYGIKNYDADQRNGYASLMFETDFDDHHSISTGLSLNHDYFKENLPSTSTSDETTPGVYAQYTYKIGEKFTLMGGLRWDHSNLWGSFVTPRMHVKYSPSSIVTLRGSVGKGYRTPHIMAENSYLLTSNRMLTISDDIGQEKAWNYGLSVQLKIPVGERSLELNAEYYYTHFLQQAIIDFDMRTIHGMADGDKSYSHTFQIDATYELLPKLNVTAAWRWNDVKSTYAGQLRSKPMNSRYKGLLTASYAPGLGKWQFDATLQLNGGGRLPENYGNSSLDRHFKAYEQVSAQITRFFRHWSIYAGGENLTGFKQKNAIISASDPWSPDFDATMIWGPVHGAVYYIGVRLNWNKI
ncbi:MAG: TonB-dependent receptor [Prevotella sp.]|nr:TonB-dependent receptor [Prevotella sp.]